IIGCLAGHFSKTIGRRTFESLTNLLCSLALLGALLEFSASLGALLANGNFSWVLPSAVPYLTYSVRLDPLSAYFNLTLSLLAAAVSAYSAGYIAHSPAGKSPGLFCAGLNLLLLSLTLTFTASNIVFFLIAWELMVVASYFLVVSDHESAEVRQGGRLYLLMSRAGTGMLYLGFMILASAAGSLEFSAMHGAARNLSPVLGGF